MSSAFRSTAARCGYSPGTPAADGPKRRSRRCWTTSANGACAILVLYRRFADAVHAFRPTLAEFLGRLRAAGKSIAAYGASAKGATMLNYCGVDHRTLDFVVDRSVTKQGFAMPGVQLPILAPEELLRRQPDFVLVLTWNFIDEIMEQQAEYRRRGGRFIVPVPEPHFVSASPTAGAASDS